MIEFKEKDDGDIKVVDCYGDTLGWLRLFIAEYVFESKKRVFSLDDLYTIANKLEALNKPTWND